MQLAAVVRAVQRSKWIRSIGFISTVVTVAGELVNLLKVAIIVVTIILILILDGGRFGRGMSPFTRTQLIIQDLGGGSLSLLLLKSWELVFVRFQYRHCELPLMARSHVAQARG